MNRKETNANQQKQTPSKSQALLQSSSLSESGPASASRFFRSSSISRYVLQLNIRKAMMISIPPIIDAAGRSLWYICQSTRATMKMVRRAATEDRTGEVREIRTRNDPENAIGADIVSPMYSGQKQLKRGEWTYWHLTKWKSSASWQHHLLAIRMSPNRSSGGLARGSKGQG